MDEPGTPKPVKDDEVSAQPFVVLDEQTFMLEVCERLNDFIKHYPNDSQQIFSRFVPYEDELAWVHQQIAGPDSAPGATVAALFCGIFQTHVGTGWVLQPVLDHSKRTLVRFKVVRQDDTGSGSE
jgi:hypothetical protein